MKSVNPTLRHEQKAKELGCSSSALQSCRQDIRMLSPYRLSPNSHERKQKLSNLEHDLERPEMTSGMRQPIQFSKATN